ncbi:MAG: hypothetical protein HZC28_03450 [Spirochaetes bacterium]|nr:hypothetical protein [Spirochaetota bacterium]
MLRNIVALAAHPALLALADAGRILFALLSHILCGITAIVASGTAEQSPHHKKTPPEYLNGVCL